MRYTVLYGGTRKETPKDAEIISHKLMIRAGMIKKLSSGLYTWLPIGLKVLQKVSNIIRQEMNSIGFAEILMPIVQPAKFWQQTERWDKYGPLLLKIKDRHEKEYCFGPTHEEIVTDLIKQDLTTYKNLPIKVYQIQTKFRDEIRPRYGVMRAREFTMKDGYSFHINQESLQETYDEIKQTYHRIFNKMGLDVRDVLADTGSIGGEISHEFHVLANSGEDLICFSDQSDFAANIELCPVIEKPFNKQKIFKNITKIKYKGDLSNAEQIPDNFDPNNLIKCLLVQGISSQPVMLILNNKHTLNPTKAEKHPKIAAPLVILSYQEIKNKYDLDIHYLGPVNSKFPIVIDNSIKGISNFTCGANEQEYYLVNVNWERDLNLPENFDLRNAEDGDLSPDGNGALKIKKGIEVSHIFQLKDTYTKPMLIKYNTKVGKSDTPLMGCYGIGVSRIVAASIEQHHDDKGIIWPTSIAPFTVIIIPINYHKDDKIKEFTDQFYNKLKTKFDVLLDDRSNSPGSKFADADLIGIPHRIVISQKLLEDNTIEHKKRCEENTSIISIDKIESFLK